MGERECVCVCVRVYVCVFMCDERGERDFFVKRKREQEEKKKRGKKNRLQSEL